MQVQIKIIGFIGERTVTMLTQIEEFLQGKLILIPQKEPCKRNVEISKQRVEVSNSYEGKWKVLP